MKYKLFMGDKKMNKQITIHLITLLAFTVYAVSNQAKLEHKNNALAIMKRNYQSQEIRGVDVKLIEAIIQVESSGNPKAVSNAGAIGLMQIKMSTAKDYCEIASNQDLLNPANNINCGVEVLKAYIDIAKARGQGLFHALKYYNAGPWNKNKNIGVDYSKKVLAIYSEL